MDPSQICSFCQNAPRKYTCPRCNADYCSLICFQSESHIECSESFYKKCVLENMPSDGEDAQSEQKMMEIFKRLHDNGDTNEGDSDDVNDEDDDEKAPLDSDDDDDAEHASLEERLANINLDDTTEVWKRLTADEKQEFEAFLRSGDVSKLIPKWEPWWLHRCESKVQDVDEIQKYKEQCPKIKEDIKDLKNITTKTPSDSVKYNLINTLTAYAFTVRYFNGDYSDFLEEAVGCIVSLSLCLKDNKVFPDICSAVESVQEECTKNEWITVDEENIALMKEDIELILKGPSESDKKYYILCALSDLYNLINTFLKRKTKSTNCFLNNYKICELSRDKVKLCLKKLEYFLSYTVHCNVV